MDTILQLTKFLDGEIAMYLNSFVKNEDKEERRKVLEDFMRQVKDVSDNLFVIHNEKQDT